MTELVLKVRSLKMLSWLRLIGENVGWKMVYNFLGIDEKTLRNLPTFDQNVRTVYSNIRTVYPSKNHVTTHPVTTTLLKWEENDHRNYFMINLHKSMGTGRDPTQVPWFFSQMCISSQTSYRLRYPPWSVVYLACWISSSHPLLDALYVYKPPKSKLCRVSHLYSDCQALRDVSLSKLCSSC